MSRKQRRTLTRIVLAAVLCIAAWASPLEGFWRLLAFVVPYLVIGYDVLWSAIRNILHGQVFDEKFLMTIATLGAFGIGEYPEAAGVMLFYQIGELFQSVAVGRSRKSIASLMDIRPDHAVVLRDGEEQTLSPEEVALGETVIVRPGEKIPLDGTVLEGQTSVNTAALTGESLPVDVGPGERVISGSINLTGVIRLRAESVYAESTVAKILELVENSSEKKARVENFITRFARYYTPCVVVAAALLAIVPPLFFSQPWGTWINRALIFLMVSCPCALVVSVPLSFFGGIGGASRDGILIKGANYLEVLSQVDTVVFDKTGTLTRGSFAVESVHPDPQAGLSADALLALAAAAESYSSHPVARSVFAAHGAEIDRSRVGEVEELAGMGLSAVIDGHTVYAGNGALMAHIGVQWEDCTVAGTIVHVARDGDNLGHIVINDELKPDSADALAALKRLGVARTVMLTGDNEAVAAAVGKAVGVDEIHARLLPAQKVEAVEHMLAEGRKLAFVGDGVNDAPVLARADVGIAMGALGSDAAIESADIVLMDDKLSKLPVAISIARRTMAIVRQNIWFALGVKGIILVLSAFGKTGIWVAVFGDVGVMVLAILNAMRAMIRHKD